MVLFVDTVAVVGAGAMGSQIAEVFALNGKTVLLHDVKPDFIAKGQERITKSLAGLAAFHESKAVREIAAAEKTLGIELTPEQKEKAAKTVRPTYTKSRVESVAAKIKAAPKLEDLKSADLVVEAVVEDLGIKSQLFSKLNTILDARAVMATNTSALPITALAEASGRPQRFLGTHFFNPPTTLPLVEIIAAKTTSEETVSDVVNVLSQMRNHRYPMLPVPVKECPGFLVNRILGAMLQEAYRCYEERVASPRDIDNAMKAGAGFPMGPLELSDLIGLDVIHHVQENSKRMGKDYEFVAEPSVVAKLVAEGRLGKKTGHGFFDYR
jgi:3-hydroxybutyryl-CoA dehydrogenase